MDVRILEIGFNRRGVCQEIVGKTCLNIRHIKLIGIEIDSYLLSQYDIEEWLIYYHIQHCMPIVMGYDWHVRWGDLSFDGFILFFSFPCDEHFFILAFLLTCKIDSIHYIYFLIILIFLLVMGAKKSLAHYAWGTNGVTDCKMDVKFAWIPKWHQMDHVSWSLGFFSKTTLGGRPNIKPGDYGTLKSHSHWFIIFYHVWGS